MEGIGVALRRDDVVTPHATIDPIVTAKSASLSSVAVSPVTTSRAVAGKDMAVSAPHVTTSATTCGPAVIQPRTQPSVSTPLSKTCATGPPSHDGTKPRTVSTMPGAGTSSTFLAAATTVALARSVVREIMLVTEPV